MKAANFFIRHALGRPSIGRLAVDSMAIRGRRSLSGKPPLVETLGSASFWSPDGGQSHVRRHGGASGPALYYVPSAIGPPKNRSALQIRRHASCESDSVRGVRLRQYEPLRHVAARATCLLLSDSADRERELSNYTTMVHPAPSAHCLAPPILLRQCPARRARTIR